MYLRFLLISLKDRDSFYKYWFKFKFWSFILYNSISFIVVKHAWNGYLFIIINFKGSWNISLLIWHGVIQLNNTNTAWKVSEYGVISGPYIPAFGLNTEYLSVFSPNAGKYWPKITSYLDTFHAVQVNTTGSIDKACLSVFICYFELVFTHWMISVISKPKYN